MPNFHAFLMRHGEHGIQDLIERMERYEALQPGPSSTLEERWLVVMQATQHMSFVTA